MQPNIHEPVLGRGSRPPAAWGSSHVHSLSPFDGEHSVVYLVESDDETRHQICNTLCGAGVEVTSFASVTEYMREDRVNCRACLIVDLQTSEKQAPGVSCRLAEAACPPVIFTCGSDDIRLAVRAMKAGAIDLMIKPLDWPVLIATVQTAFAQDEKLRKKRSEVARLEQNLATLTPREREVLPLITGGLLNKQAASLLGISEVTLQIHRSQVMRKMQAGSVADLVRMGSKLRLPYWQASRPGHSMPPLSAHFGTRDSRMVATGMALR